MKGGRLGLRRCGPCKREFTVTVGTIFERSVTMHKWFQAAHLMASQKGYRRPSASPHAEGHIQDRLVHGTSLARSNARSKLPPFGGEGKPVEIDETYIGGKEKNKHSNKRHGVGGGYGKEAVFSLVERGGNVRSYHVPTVSAKTLRPILQDQIHAASRVMSDDGGARVGRMFAVTSPSITALASTCAATRIRTRSRVISRS